jgi:hypothetical protein
VSHRSLYSSTSARVASSTGPGRSPSRLAAGTVDLAAFRDRSEHQIRSRPAADGASSTPQFLHAVMDTPPDSPERTGWSTELDAASWRAGHSRKTRGVGSTRGASPPRGLEGSVGAGSPRGGIGYKRLGWRAPWRSLLVGPLRRPLQGGQATSALLGVVSSGHATVCSCLSGGGADTSGWWGRTRSEQFFRLVVRTRCYRCNRYKVRDFQGGQVPLPRVVEVFPAVALGDRPASPRPVAARASR